MTGKKIIPILISIVEDSASEKLRSFFAGMSPEYQLKSINLWAWRSELRPEELVAVPVKVNVNGTVHREEWLQLISSLRESGATGLVLCSMDIMLRVGLELQFIKELRRQGLELWTSESVFPIQDEEFSLV